MRKEIKTYQIHLKSTQDNDYKETFLWVYRSPEETMKEIVEKAIQQADLRSETEKKNWIVVNIKRID